MKAVVLSDFGGPEVMRIDEQPDPKPGPGELLVKVKASALNRADLLQRRGLYPPPKGASEVLGLEMAGVVEAAGEGVTGWQEGMRVCALLPGGGYAEYAVIPADMAMLLPDGLSFEEGAALPEVFLTAYLNLFWLGGMKAGASVLIHAGASGVGTAAIQLVREAGGKAYVTAGSPAKLEACRKLGAEAGWNYREGSFAPWIQEKTKGQGVPIILDFIGEPYFHDNLASLSFDGRLVVIGTLGGPVVTELNLGQLLGRRLQIIGTALRSRSPEEKIRLTAECHDFLFPRLKDGRIKPVVDRVFDWREVRGAHEYMESNANIGKIILHIAE